MLGSAFNSNPVPKESAMRWIVPAALVILAAAPASAGGLEDFLSNLNIEARADLNGFSARVSSQFSVGGAQVRVVLDSVQEPADAFMVFQLGRMTRRPPEEVLRVYREHKGKGWGALAQELGIKPGSAEFHALKKGDFRLEGSPDEGRGKGKGKGRGRGHNKD